MTSRANDYLSDFLTREIGRDFTSLTKTQQSYDKITLSNQLRGHMGFYIRSTVISTKEVKQPGMRFGNKEEAVRAMDGLYKELVRLRTENEHALPEKFLSVITDPHSDLLHEIVPEGR